MSNDNCYRINDRHVVYETFDDEVLAVNTDTGTYYSMTGPAANLWTCILAGTTTDAAAHALSTVYLGEPPVMKAAIIDFFAQMQRENLIVADATPQSAGTITLPLKGAKVPFEIPTMTVFTDMQDLLLLDPIHDVDAAGWPAAKTDPPRPGDK